MDIPFYRNGLRFKCKRCSNCCRLSPGYVFLSENDIKDLLAALKIERAKLLDKYCRIVNINSFLRISLKEKENYDCIFWKQGYCAVYNKRPLQCRSYPFWSSILSSKKLWLSQKESCPGIDNGSIHPRQKIEYWLKKRIRDKFIEISPNKVSTIFKDQKKI